MTTTTKLLVGVPDIIEDSIVNAHKEIVYNFRLGKWEPAELNGGKLCESIYCLLFGALNASYPSTVTKPHRFPDACKALESIKPPHPIVGERSLRILIPRSLPYIYDIRNNRGVGHVGGDVDPNYMDSLCVLSFSNWVVAELVRIFHSVSIQDAQAIVNGITERHLPSIWKVGDTRRVLNSEMSMPDQTIVLLYDADDWVSVDDLFSWVEYSRKSKYIANVIRRLHRTRLVEYDAKQQRCIITVKGVLEAEKLILKG